MARHVRESLSDRFKNGIPCEVAVRIVDRLEFIQVHEHYGEHPTLSSRLGDSVFQAVMEEHAVGESRELIMQGSLSRVSLLLERRGQLMVEKRALFDFAPKLLIEHTEFFIRFV